MADTIGVIGAYSGDLGSQMAVALVMAAAVVVVVLLALDVVTDEDEDDCPEGY